MGLWKQLQAIQGTGAGACENAIFAMGAACCLLRRDDHGLATTAAAHLQQLLHEDRCACQLCLA